MHRTRLGLCDTVEAIVKENSVRTLARGMEDSRGTKGEASSTVPHTAPLVVLWHSCVQRTRWNVYIKPLSRRASPCSFRGQEVPAVAQSTTWGRKASKSHNLPQPWPPLTAQHSLQSPLLSPSHLQSSNGL
jgi:hypothetical protein